MRKSTTGFTLVELLIVIVVIAILAAITIVAYSGIQAKARVTAIASELKSTEKALNAYKIVSGTADWWPERNTNDTIKSMIADMPQFRNFLQKAPTTDGLGASGDWYYDNDGDTYNGCSASYAGVNINIIVTNNSKTKAIMEDIDTAADDGNLSCGKVRFVSPSWFVYGLD